MNKDKYYGYGPGKDAQLLQGFNEFDGKWYYFDLNNDYRMASGVQKIDGSGF